MFKSKYLDSKYNEAYLIHLMKMFPGAVALLLGASKVSSFSNIFIKLYKHL